MHDTRFQYLALFTLIAVTTVMALPIGMNTRTADLGKRKHSTTSADPTVTSTATLADPTLTGNSTTGSAGSSNGLDALFPVSNSVSNWTTFPDAPDALPLSNDTLKPFKTEKGMTHNLVSAPDGKLAMQAKYPEGSYIPSKKPLGGFSFYAPGPDSVNLTTAKEATFGYSVMFPEGFQFNMGGKLPGIYGGDDAETAVSCSGGRRDHSCFSARLMWRPNGAGELYTYLPDSSEGSQFAANDKICDIPNSECNPRTGPPSRAARSPSQRLKLNTPDQADGELELFVGGQSVISPEGRMRGMQMQTFFGGSTRRGYFADFSVAIISTL
ncbi:hypothetical protein B0H13DRAFT_2077791 [Mycena leptocephala]|nr:hypothetical protein B0H13DRAFT_2077791 [Mycena leptocephala]